MFLRRDSIVYTNSKAIQDCMEALRRQGLSLELLHCVFHAIIVNKITYAISAWYGFLNKSHVLQINSFFQACFQVRICQICHQA